LVYRILNLEPDNYSSQAAAILAEVGMLENAHFDMDELLRRLGDYDALIVRLAYQIDRKVIDAGRRLKAIVTATTGLDHIDVAYAQSKGIAVLSLRGEYEFLRSIPATAEHTWGLLLALLRHIPAAHASVLMGEWERDRFRGHDLSGQTLGILGLGRIGEKIARYGLAFNMRVQAFDPYRQTWIDGVGRSETQVDLLQQSQVFTIHVPLNDSTQGLIGREELELLPRGAVLINTARGEVVDEAALIAVLESGHLAGAALDVVCDERSEGRKDSSLLAYARSHASLVLTPHIGGATVESMAATEIFMARKLQAYLLGQR
jgi:D-3-phosphoglycerate dehydrogenase